MLVFVCLLFPIHGYYHIFFNYAFEQTALGVQEKRLQEVMQYQTLLTDLEQWLITVNATLRTETQPTSPEAIRDQLLAHEVSIPTVRQDLVTYVTNNFKVVLLFLTDVFNIIQNPSFLRHVP
jgi:hypothetical protein